MPREQIIGNIVIGIFLLILGAASRPIFKKLWTWMNRPAPLSPQTRGQLTTTLAWYESALERLNYFSTHAKDLYLYLLTLLFSALFLLIIGAFLFIVQSLHWNDAYVSLRILTSLIILVLAGIFCAIGLVEASRMSDKRINGQKARIQKAIDETRQRLNTPQEPPPYDGGGS